MIDMRGDTGTADLSDLPTPPLGGSQVQGETSIWAEWLRLNTKSNFGSAIQLYQEALTRTSELSCSWVESTVTPVDFYLERAADATLTPVDLPTLCHYFWDKPTRRTLVQLFQGGARPPRDATERSPQTERLISQDLVASLTAYAFPCKWAAGRSLVQSAEVIAEHLTDFEYVGPQLELIESRYSLRVRSEVLRFVWEHAYLQPLLVQAHQRVREYFPSAELVLDVVHDREVDGWEELVILISTDLPVDEAGAALDRLDEEWWLDRLPDARGKLSIDLQFI